MLFNPKAIGKMKMAELEDAIKVYDDNIEEVKVVELANNNERMSFLEALVKEHGVPVDTDGVITFEPVTDDEEPPVPPTQPDAAEGSLGGDDDGDDEDTEEEEEEGSEANSEASEGSEEELEDDNVAEKLGEAIEKGEMRWEGRLITGFRNKPLSGQIFFELFGNDNSTYLASRSDLVKHFGIKDEA